MFLFSPETSPQPDLLPKTLWGILEPQLRWVTFIERGKDEKKVLTNSALPPDVRAAAELGFRHTDYPLVEVCTFGRQYIVFASNRRSSRRKRLLYPKELDGALGDRILSGAKRMRKRSAFYPLWKESDVASWFFFSPIMGALAGLMAWSAWNLHALPELQNVYTFLFAAVWTVFSLVFLLLLPVQAWRIRKKLLNGIAHYEPLDRAMKRVGRMNYPKLPKGFKL